MSEQETATGNSAVRASRRRGLLIVISAPSGGGKSTILHEVMRSLPELVFSVSHTTRPPRQGELDGVHYHFVSQEAFLHLRDQQPSGFLEWAEVHGNLYGTGIAEICRQQEQGIDVVLDIDVQGAEQVRSQMDAVTIFIAPPSLAELERRLRGRATESEGTLTVRLSNARKEMAAAPQYQYLVINDQLDQAILALRSIIIAERHRQRAA